MKKLLCAVLMVPTFIHAFVASDINNPGGLVINAPGTYSYTGNGNIQVNAVTANQAVLINASNVVFDLAAAQMTQQGSSAVIGIDIAPGVSNVTIQNGTVYAFNTQVQIEAGAVNPAITNFTVSRGSSGINAVGTAMSPITDLTLTNVTCMAADLDLTYANAAGFINVLCQGSGMNIVSCNNGTMVTCIVKGNQGDSATGLLLQDCLSWNIQNSNFDNHLGLMWGANGAYVYGSQVNTSGSHTFNGCSFSGNTGVSIARGLALINTTSCIVSNCVMNANSSQTGYAIGCLVNNSVAGITTISTCSAQDNAVTGENPFGQGMGFSLSTTGLIISNCASIGNSSAQGTGIGFLVASPSYSNTVTMCQAFDNSTHGFVNNDSTTTFVQCAAIGQNSQDYAGSFAPAYQTQHCLCIHGAGMLTATSATNISFVAQS